MIYEVYEEQYRAVPYPKLRRPTMEWLKERMRYDNRVEAIREEFRLALSVEYGIKGHAKESKVWERVWREGHSEGYEAMEQRYRDLAEIVKE